MFGIKGSWCEISTSWTWKAKLYSIHPHHHFHLTTACESTHDPSLDGKKSSHQQFLLGPLPKMGPFPCLSCFTATKSNATDSTTQLERLCHRFSLAQLRAATNDFHTSLIVGGEGTCEVYKGHLKPTGDIDIAAGRNVAIKRFKTRTPAGDIEFRVEVQILCQLRHPNVVPLIGFCEHKNDKFVVYDYFSNGTLHDCLHNTSGNTRNVNNPLSWKQRLEICIGAARGLHYIHCGTKSPIIHCAVKSSNILLDENLTPKVADFGLCKKERRGESRPKAPRVEVRENLEVSLEYMDPEYHMTGWLSMKSDVYSFGVVLLEVLSAKEAYLLTPDGDYKYLVKWAFDAERSGIPDKIVDPFLVGKIAPECWKVYIEIVQRCLVLPREERPTMGEVEVVLENVLRLQEKADFTKERNDPGAQYSLA